MGAAWSVVEWLVGLSVKPPSESPDPGDKETEELKQERNPEKVEEKARMIYEDYVSILSPREVSLDSRVREIINKNMMAPTQNTFDEAQLQIYTLMHRDSYSRFVNSGVYKELLRSTGAEPPLSVSGGGENLFECE